MTDRISVFKTSPATTFTLECDRIGQSIVGNYTTLRLYLRANNGPGGSTGSFFGGAGTQTGIIDGVSTFGVHSGSPFLPSGFVNGEQRWRDGPFDVNVPHGADGTRGAVTLRMRLQYGSINEDHTVSFNDFPRIPRGPRVKDGGVWKNTILYVKDAGVWKIAIPYVKDAGTWKIGGG